MLMSILSIFKTNNKAQTSADTAKERLKIVISHQRSNAALSSLLPKIQQDIVAVLRKYVNEIVEDQIDIKLQQQLEQSILELNVTIPS
jgi:cell division topological specificity factor